MRTRNVLDVGGSLSTGIFVAAVVVIIIIIIIATPEKDKQKQKHVYQISDGTQAGNRGCYI